MSRKQRVGFDLDGVLYDYSAAFKRYLDSIGYEYNYDESHMDWCFYEKLGLTEEEYTRLAHAGVDADVIFRGPTLPGAVEAVQKIKDAGHSIHIVTARDYGTPGKAAWATYQWLDGWGIPYDTVTFASDKRIVDLDVFIDDFPKNIEQMSHVGIEAYLLDRPWNTEADLPRVKTLDEYVEIVLEDWR